MNIWFDNNTQSKKLFGNNSKTYNQTNPKNNT